ncbi:YebC/PmpR family DNA-binding transcriptional regulator [Salisediminibacterium halotolerans]|uniref:Probable transcriptional regulatory protein SAMN05444126_11958 n=1 Tax=Salisediminibacterium halotolerans TaxID=517425 RepID=A0A1H9VC65_9BACI|nr:MULTISPECIES: YebC/PmpR family DNA-binding transcriptional regulator [Salisediminibacterium]RLJ78394.1 YebC/PmpR family DNA-binding regulatory protein [Actinophytocola xinjiangensis]RPE88264.1 YebC/PmpR family DNA-binding regulatory protein [Salisediminibacterium halotolerans]TWG37370.1 YebC/PmpR family DNA-binding regulatory protein [Salisediminibacterium halotolerans]SES19178.1 DNA-binding regulatory protein, YebC/PmpR family [Salisediminibacterium haloalkalitolerans]GEL06835.1 putative t
MAGHSKWHNIKHRKAHQDKKKGKIFTKLTKEIHQAVRQGGDDPYTNYPLKLAIDKAKQNNLPNENIERTIQKASGNVDGIDYEEITYEGYAPHGVAVFVEALTENRNRTAAEVRLQFNKNGGNLGEDGCVAFMFHRKGQLMIEKDEATDEEQLMLEAIEAGADDVQVEDEYVQIITVPDAFQDVKDSLEQAGYAFEFAEVTQIPDIYADLDDQQAEEAHKLIEALEDLDDVQNVYHNLV